MSDKVTSLREASGSNYIQITPEEALELAKNEPDLDKVLILMISKDKGMSSRQGGGMAAQEQLWYMERLKTILIGPI